MKMKPFDLAAAKAGAPVCTRDGRDVRIICYDRRVDECVPENIIVLISDGSREIIASYNDDGRFSTKEHEYDLMMKTVRKEGWMVINKKHIGEDLYKSKEHAISAVEEAAKKYGAEGYAVAHIEWEE